MLDSWSGIRHLPVQYSFFAWNIPVITCDKSKEGTLSVSVRDDIKRICFVFVHPKYTHASTGAAYSGKIGKERLERKHFTLVAV